MSLKSKKLARPLPPPTRSKRKKRPKISVVHKDKHRESLPSRIWMDQFTTYRMHSTTKLISTIAARLYKDRLGINIIESRVINLVAALGPMSTRELSKHSRMDRVTVSRASQSLVARGMLDRIANTEDRRLIRLSLTPAGLAAHHELVQLLNWFEESVCDALGMKKVETLRENLNQLEEYFLHIQDEIFPNDGSDN